MRAHVEGAHRARAPIAAAGTGMRHGQEGTWDLIVGGGGNARHTRNFRCMHRGPLSVLTDSYGEDEYFNDLLLVTRARRTRTAPAEET